MLEYYELVIIKAKFLLKKIQTSTYKILSKKKITFFKVFNILKQHIGKMLSSKTIYETYY